MKRLIIKGWGDRVLCNEHINQIIGHLVLTDINFSVENAIPKKCEVCELFFNSDLFSLKIVPNFKKESDNDTN